MAKKTVSGLLRAGDHMTLTDAADVLVRSLERLGCRKVSPGHITRTSGRSSTVRYKAAPINGGFKVTVRQAATIQELWVYTDDPTLLDRALAQA